MSNSIRLRNLDWTGVGAIILIGGFMAVFRQLAIVPRRTVGLCAGPNAPAGFCAPRAAVLWLQYHQLFGWAALALGLFAFTQGRRWPAILAIGIGIEAVVNFNATFGVIGAALGLVAWIGLNTGRYSSQTNLTHT